jgi:hypothetical protein
MKREAAAKAKRLAERAMRAINGDPPLPPKEPEESKPSS